MFALPPGCPLKPCPVGVPEGMKMMACAPMDFSVHLLRVAVIPVTTFVSFVTGKSSAPAIGFEPYDVPKM